MKAVELRPILLATAIATALAGVARTADLPLTAGPLAGRAAALAQASPPAGTLIDHPCTNCAVSVAATNDAVWVGTESVGIVRWDRATGAMRHFTRADGLGGDAAWMMAAETRGRVWAVMRDRSIIDPHTGLSLYDGGRWMHFPTSTEPITRDAKSMVADPVAGVWLSDNLTTAHFDGDVWRTTLAQDGTSVGGYLAADGNGGLWLASDQTVYRLVGTAWEARHPFGTVFRTARARSLAVAADGALYVGLVEAGSSDGLGVARFDGVAWHLFSVGDGLGPGVARALAIDGAGTVWVAFSSNPNQVPDLGSFDGARWRMQSTADTPGLPGDNPRSFSVAPDGVLAMASLAGGAGIHAATGWSTLRDQSQPAAFLPWALGQAPDGALWSGFAFTTGSHAIQRRSGGRWQTWTLADGIPNLRTLAASPRAIAFSGDGTPWLGTWFSGVLTREGGRWHTLSQADGLPSDTVWDVLVDRSDRLWLATSNGVVLRGPGGLTVYTAADGLPSNDVHALAAAADGTIWAGTPSGAARFDGQRWITMTTLDGLPNNHVNVVATGADGAVWFGTDAGLARLDASGWRTWARADGLPGDRIVALDIDAAGRAWAGDQSDRGLASVGLFVIDESGWQLLSTADGLFDPSVFDIEVTRDGHVWIATFLGVQEFIPDRIVLPPTPAPTSAATPHSHPTCTCRAARRALPAAVLANALANPSSYAGWGERVNPNLPPSSANPLRACLDLQNPGTPFHALFNGPVWRGSCR